MPGHPPGSCLPCRIVKEVSNKVKNNVEKNIKIYAFFAILLIEFLSIRYSNSFDPNVYAYKVYPTLANIEFSIIFFAVYLHTERLRFCMRQKLIVLSLLIYFLFNVLTILLPICWSSYYVYGSYGILSVILILFIATWRNL